MQLMVQVIPLPELDFDVLVVVDTSLFKLDTCVGCAEVHDEKHSGSNMQLACSGSTELLVEVGGGFEVDGG